MIEKNIVHSIFQQFKGEQLNTRIYKNFASFFKNNEEKVFFMKKHDDVSFGSDVHIKIKKAYKHFVLIAKLDHKGNELFVTAINYASLLDCQNQKEEYVWQIEYI